MGLNNKQRLDRQRLLDARAAELEKRIAEFEALPQEDELDALIAGWRDELEQVRAAKPEDLKAIIGLAEAGAARMRRAVEAS